MMIRMRAMRKEEEEEKMNTEKEDAMKRMMSRMTRRRRGARLDVGLGVFSVSQLGRRRAPPAVFKREPQEHPIKIFRADFRNWPRVRQICPKYAAVTKYYAVSERDGISYPSEYS